MTHDRIRAEFEGLRIGVLSGGTSSEREISLASGRAVQRAFSEAQLDCHFIDVRGPQTLLELKEKGIDAAFIALHGAFGEDGAAQKILEELQIPYTGSGVDASALAMNKLRSKERFRAGGLKTPAWFEAGEEDPTDRSFPCVVKPSEGGSSMGLSVVRSADRLSEAMEKARKISGSVIVERFIEGRELTVGVLGTRSLPVVEIVPLDGVYDVEAKYSSKHTKYVLPAPIPGSLAEEASRMALSAHEALGCRGFSRVDFRLSPLEELFVLEVNTIPGLTERSLLPMAAREAGLDFTQLCAKMLREGLNAFATGGNVSI